jgi:progressive ankylosis protein
MLRYRQIFDFYWPLVLTSQMMTLAAPIINMGLGRSADPKVQLAGYAVGFGLLVFMNSPLFPFVQTNAVLGVGSNARNSLFRKQISLAAIIAFIQLVMALVPGSEAIFSKLMGSTPAVSELARKVALVQWPIPLLITTRSYFYGLVMRHKNTRIISQATGLRLALLASIIFGAMGLGHMPGAMLGAAALTVGIATEMVYISLRGLRLLRQKAKGIDGPEPDGMVSWHGFMAFIGPLMVNAVTWSAMRPVLNAIVGRTADPDLAQASFGFVLPLLILSSSPLWAFNSTTVVLVKKREDLPTMLRFGLITIALFIVGIAVVVWTPLRDLLLDRVFSLRPGQALYVAVVPALILIPYQPITLGLRTISSGFLMSQHRTRAIGVTSSIKLALVLAVGFWIVRDAPALNGALLGALLLMGSETVETLMIMVRTWKLYRSG